jgi:hypothetical protein
MKKDQENFQFAAEHPIWLLHPDPFTLTLQETGAQVGEPIPWSSLARLQSAKDSRINVENGPFCADGLESRRQCHRRARE